jgi:TPR repeat protein
MHNNGYGVHQDNAEALKWYRLAAEQGHANAQYNLGFMYANGKGVLEDFAEALKWYRLSAELLVNYCGCPKLSDSKLSVILLSELFKKSGQKSRPGHE